MWAMRAVWALLPAALVASLAAGLETRSDGVRLVVAIALWAAWAVVLGALFVPNTVTLTIVRVLVPASIVVVVPVAAHGGFDVGDGLALAASIVATALCFLPAVGAVFLHGVAYGDEERVALRAPGILLLGPIEIAWVVLLAAAATGPLLLAARQWIAGAVLTVAGLAVVAALAAGVASARAALARVRAVRRGAARPARARRPGAAHAGSGQVVRRGPRRHRGE